MGSRSLASVHDTPRAGNFWSQRAQAAVWGRTRLSPGTSSTGTHLCPCQRAGPSSVNQRADASSQVDEARGRTSTWAAEHCPAHLADSGAVSHQLRGEALGFVQAMHRRLLLTGLLVDPGDVDVELRPATSHHLGQSIGIDLAAESQSFTTIAELRSGRDGVDCHIGWHEAEVSQDGSCECRTSGRRCGCLRKSCSHLSCIA